MRYEGLAALGAVIVMMLYSKTVHGEDVVPFPAALERSAIAEATFDEAINDALVLGNGDLNGLLYAEKGDVVFRITKNDVWDARLDTTLDPPLPTLKRLKELGASDTWTDREWILPEGSTWKGPDSYSAHPYPCPRACAVLRIAGGAAKPLAAKLDIQRAMADVFAADGRTRLLCVADANAVVGYSDPARTVTIEPIQSADIPAAETGERNGCTWIAQTIPGDLDWPGMRFAVALASREGRFAAAVVTSREAGDPVAAAIALAIATRDRDRAELETAHTAVWTDFWNQSGIELSDEVLERTWYRNLYFLRCVSKPGVISTGLFAGLLNDMPAWHGDYHTNYNIQQTYWAAYSANHGELAEPYDRLITDYLPRARWLAKTIFDAEGAFFPHVLYAYEPSDPAQCKSPNGRQYIHHVWGFTLGVSAFTVQPLWWQYKYTPDVGYLEYVAYPAIRDVAIFYADFVNQCEPRGEAVILAPTVSPEHHGWTAHFARNRNSSFCIAYADFIFDAAIEAAETLERDKELIARWEAAKAKLPGYPLYEGPKGDVIVDVAGAEPMAYNIPVPTTPIFPAEEITMASSSTAQALFRRTLNGLEHNGNNAPVMLAVARARLNMPDAYDWLRTEIDRRERRNGFLSFNRLDPRHGFNDFGHYTEMFGAALPVTELLLQSVDEIVRLFPAWPAHLPAAFENLRAQGGFLVSAAKGGGGLTRLEVNSTVGGELCIVIPWSGCEVRRDGDGAWEKAPCDENGFVVIVTHPAETLTFRQRPVWSRIRGEGVINTFQREGDCSVMAIRGDAGASTGYKLGGLAAKGFSEIAVEVKGGPNAQYFIEIETGKGGISSGWKPSPTEWTTVALTIPAGAEVESVILYTMTKDGADASNAFRSIKLTGSGVEESIDLSQLE
ncbi:MAG: hypothetical protein QG656_1863 [Candidatus Hydrogenedentes bacterium]|nr:hypothetical protein [Candidatus Hydrogenedentota bacterium]